MKSCHRKNWLSLTTVIPSLVCDGERKEGERERERGREGEREGGEGEGREGTPGQNWNVLRVF